MTQPIPTRKLMNREGYTLGVGINSADGSPTNTAVTGDVEAPAKATGSIQQLSFSQISSTEELESSLGIDISASYGGFGVGASARFGFSQKTQVNSNSVFLTITGSYQASSQSINNIVLTPDAAALVSNSPSEFALRYGDMFLRAMDRGGIFVGVYRIDCEDSSASTDIQASLHGSYGAFNADAALALKNIATNSRVSIYCSVYAEGGPHLSITDPRDPNQLINAANQWFAAFSSDPDGNSIPQGYLAQPLTMAAGPMPLNTVDLLHAQDVLTQCYNERLRILGEMSACSTIVDDAVQQTGRFIFTNPTTLATVQTAYNQASADLDTLAKAASQAMDDPKSACTAATYAGQHALQYPTFVLPDPMPTLKPYAPPPPKPTTIPTPSLMNMTVTQVQSACGAQSISWEDAYFSMATPTLGRMGTLLSKLRQADTVFQNGKLVVISPPHTDDQIVVVGQLNPPNNPFPLDGSVKMELYFGLAPGVH